MEEDYKILFILGGNFTSTVSKPGYNIIIKGDHKSLHGTKSFSLKSDPVDFSMMRSKLSSVILQKSGLISIEVGYTELYVNEKYMGFWVVSDIIDDDWIRRKFNNINEVKTLYICDEDTFIRLDDGTAKTKCINANYDYINYTEPFNNFIDQVNMAKTKKDLEKIIDVENFIKYMAWEWLVGSYDHILSFYCHNFFWYQQPNGKWVYIPFDFGESTFGSNQRNKYYKKLKLKKNKIIDFAYISFKDFELNHPIIKILIHDDDTSFRNMLGDIISKIYNPDTLLIYIDKIKNLISPYVKKDRDLGAGKINKIGKDIKMTYENFLLNTEYTYIFDKKFGIKNYGLKDWIRKRYNFASSYYGINTNSDSNNKRHKLIEPRPKEVILSYYTKTKIEKHNNIYYIIFQNKLSNYIPNKNYTDNTLPIGTNKYNQEKN
eukprot:jgi/Orpsp1_1/1184755/evm.model.c7180000090871.1